VLRRARDVERWLGACDAGYVLADAQGEDRGDTLVQHV
jgi:hypothetical protein